MGLRVRASSLRGGLLLAAALPLLAPRPAHADGAFPDSIGILTPEQLPNETLLSTNFGLVMSFDGEQTWVWACEQGANSYATLYQMGPPPRNRIFAVSPMNLIFSDDSSCTWTASAPGTQDAFADPTNADRVLAVVGTAVDGGSSTYTLVESADGGATFPQLLYTAAAGDHITGVEISRSNPQTVYLTITSGTAYSPKIAVTTNGGGSWTLHDLSASLPGTYSIRLVAIDPGNPQRLFLRTGSASGQALALSTDGGTSVTTPLTFPSGAFTAFSRMASGSLIAGGVLGTTPVGFRSTDNGTTFTQLPMVPFNFTGMSSRGTTLYATTENMLDAYAIYTSPDEGMSWQPLMAFNKNIQAIETCLMQYCQTDCENRAGMGLFSPDNSDAICSAAVMPALVDAGLDAAGPPPPHDAGPPPTSDASPAKDAATGTNSSGGGGCHCDLTPAVGPPAWPWLLVAAGLRARRRRQR